MNVLDDNKKHKETCLKNIVSEKVLLKKIELTVLFIQNFKTSFSEKLDVLKLFHSSDVIQTVCQKMNLMKDEIQSYMLKDFLTEEGEYEINFRAPYFIAKNVSISDLTYELQGEMLCIDGNYVLTTECELELDENDPVSQDDRFKDREFDGCFGVEIDKNMKINFVHSDMSAYDQLSSMQQGFTEKEIKEYYKRFPEEKNQFDDMLTLDHSDYDDISKSLGNKEPLTGKALELALELVDIKGDDEQSKFIKNIGVKMKAGKPLDEYEYHIVVDVLMLHAKIGEL